MKLAMNLRSASPMEGRCGVSLRECRLASWRGASPVSPDRAYCSKGDEQSLFQGQNKARAFPRRAHSQSQRMYYI